VESHHDLISLFEHDLFGKPGFHFSGSCSDVGELAPMAEMFTDPATMEWQAKRPKAGQSEWARSNAAVELEI